MPTYSHSRLSTYEACPLQYKLKYIDKIEVEKEEGIEAFLGSRVHDALERLYKGLRYSKLLTLDEVVHFYNSVCTDVRSGLLSCHYPYAIERIFSPNKNQAKFALVTTLKYLLT